MVMIAMLVGASLGALVGIVAWALFGVGILAAVSLYFGLSFLGLGLGVLAQLRARAVSSSVPQVTKEADPEARLS